MSNEEDDEVFDSTAEESPQPVASASAPVSDRAEACVRFVERALKVRLDYTIETLPLLDHYLATARAEARARPETVPLLVEAAGAYFGEVIRRRHAAHWREEGDPGDYRLELEGVYLSFCPADIMRQARFFEDNPEPFQALTLLQEDQATLAARLAELPEVTDEELYSPSTCAEVIDLAVDLFEAQRMARGDPPQRPSRRHYDD